MRYRPNFEAALEERAKSFYAEHYRRLSRSRFYAKWVHVTYPVVAFLLFGVPAVAVTLALNFAYSLNSPKLSDILPPTSQEMVMNLMWTGATLLSALAFIVGIFLGISKSRELIFEAEEYELKLRHEYYAQKLTDALAQIGN